MIYFIRIRYHLFQILKLIIIILTYLLSKCDYNLLRSYCAASNDSFLNKIIMQYFKL